MSNRIFYDCEFIEDGLTIEPISIAMIRESGESYYAITNNYHTINRARERQWLVDNVLSSLPIRRDQSTWHFDSLHEDFDHVTDLSSQGFRDELLAWLDGKDVDGPIELWADYGAYDHVMLMQLFGPMVQKPEILPYWTHDFQQELSKWLPDFTANLPAQEEGLHNALSDARHLRRQFQAFQEMITQPF
jgi:hypothetical protein